MITRVANFPRTVALVAVLVSIFLGPALSAAGQTATNRDRDAGSPPLADLSAHLAEQYPTLRALVLARGPCVFFEYYRKDIGIETQSPVYSVSKSVLSILVGIAVDEGYLRLDEKLSEIVPEEFDEIADPLARDITVRDLLTKTEGFAETGEGDFKMSSPVPGKSQAWRWMLNRTVKYPAGTHFRYDGIGSDLLSVVLSKAIKQSAADFAKQKLFDPLHIDNYTWPADSEGYLHGESGLSLTARDMAKIGLLYLDRGRWGDAQIVSEDYVRDSTSRHNDGGPPVNAAYGYQWWISETNANFDAFFAAGHKSQLIYVVPGRDLVAAVSADSIPGGSPKLINHVVLPAVARLSGPPSCAARFGK
jgi:CubicO group peptidase (beta-lactamase class C family)